MDASALMEFAFYGICLGMGGPVLIVFGMGLIFWAWCKQQDLL